MSLSIPDPRKLFNMARGAVLNAASKDRGFLPQVDSHVLVPEGKVVDGSLKNSLPKNWRKEFAGRIEALGDGSRGLEIGALHQPLKLSDSTNVDYLDYCTLKELRSKYPELSGYDLVDPKVIDNAETLETIELESYDFLVSAHVIEHMRNPIGALENWLRVLKPGGLLYLVVPDKRATFDRKRVRTNLEHLILDYRKPSLARDKEHFIEYARHVEGFSENAALERAEELDRTGVSIHFHVFMPEDITGLLAWARSELKTSFNVDGPYMNPGGHEFHFLLSREA